MEYSIRYIDCYPLPTAWDWAAKDLAFKDPDPCIRNAPGGEQVVVPTNAETKARNIALQTPGNNKEEPKAIHDRTTQDGYPEVQQNLNKGSIGLDPKDVYLEKEGK